MPSPRAFRSRSDTLRQVRAQEFAQWFEHRRWRVATERSGERIIDGAKVYYDRGEFWISVPGVKYQTPLGGKGQHGFLLQEVDQAGRDIPGSVTPWGLTAVRKAADLYNAITGEVPPPTRRRRYAEPEPAQPR